MAASAPTTTADAPKEKEKNAHIAQAELILSRAKAAYTNSLRAVDTTLHRAVCQDPKNLGDATKLQGTYGTFEDFKAAELKGLEQPKAGPSDPPVPPPAEAAPAAEPAKPKAAK